MSLRIFAIILAVLVASPTLAGVSLSDRSPFAQGHWWDPTRSGSGFDIFNANGQVGVVWFTYDERGLPIWYTAGGRVDTIGAQSWPLVKHRWSNGRKADPAVVGSVLLKLRHPELADLTWTIGDKQGTWTIQPLIVSGIVNEIDHSGHWFDPANSGWGFSLVEQGDVLGGALFAYDPAGEPTWVSGFQHGGNSVAYFSYNGACPWCIYRPSAASAAGRISYEIKNETSITVHNSLTVPLAAGTNVDGAHVVQLGRPASTRPADRQLASFDSDSVLKAYLDAGMQNIPSNGASAFSPGPPSTPFSPTNLQEAGVDEADLIKTDGRFIYTFTYNSTGARQPGIRIAQVGDEGANLVVLGSVPLAGGASTPVASAGLYLYADKLVVVTGSQAATQVGAVWTSPAAWSRGLTYIEVMRTSDTGLPSTRWRAEIDGNVVASRRIGQRLYVVSRFVPYIQGFLFGYLPGFAANQQLLAGTPLGGLLPKVRINGGNSTALVDASSTYAPPQGSQKPIADMILVTAIDLEQPRIAQSFAIAGAVETVYASDTSLFLATSRYELRDGNGTLFPAEPPFYLTDIHQVRLASDAMKIVGSASIEGYLGTDADSASFRLSEYQNRLRAVTSSGAIWGSANKNRLTILEPSTTAPGVLKTVSYLPNALRPQPLGKPSELLYGVRFLADRLYAVSFRMIDPLYVVDIADSTDPRIAGALNVPGFSQYLHPLPSGLLIGFGKDAKASDTAGDGQFGWYQGLQLSLFDVRDVGQPREIQRVIMGKRGSDSVLLRDHHGFSALMASDGTGQIAFPAKIHDGPTPQSGSGDSAYYPWQQSGLMRFELRGTSAADAQLSPLPSLITSSATQAPNIDAAATNARSVLFRKGSIYVGNGQFWRQDLTGAAFGPY